MYGHKDLSAYQDLIDEGRHHIRKLVQSYKLNKIDYLSLCDMTRKIYKCFDFDHNQNLDKLETKQLLEAFSSEMNMLGTTLTKNTFKEWFAKIDQDGSDSISLPELILALSGIMKVEVPAEA